MRKKKKRDEKRKKNRISPGLIDMEAVVRRVTNKIDPRWKTKTTKHRMRKCKKKNRVNIKIVIGWE